MWKKLYEFIIRVLTLAQTSARHDDQIEDLRQEMMHIASQVNRLSDRQKSDRELVKLWVENQLLKFEKRLLPALSQRDHPPSQETNG